MSFVFELYADVDAYESDLDEDGSFQKIQHSDERWVLSVWANRLIESIYRSGLEARKT